MVVSNDMIMKTSPFAWVVPISHRNFDGSNYPLHVHLDNRTKSDGAIYVEQLRSFDYKRRKWQFIEYLPSDLFEEVQKKIRLTIS